jgi:hypothetical protein
MSLSWHLIHFGVVGAFFGLGSLLSVLAGLWSRCWIAGFWSAWLLACVAMVGTGVAENYEPRFSSVADLPMILLGTLVLPAIIFAMTAPHLMMRALCGWRLDAADRLYQPRRPLGLLDLMAMVTVLASVISLLRVPQIIWHQSPSQYYREIGMLAAAWSAVCLLLVIPSLWCTFRGRTWPRRWLLPVGLYLLGMGLLVIGIERTDDFDFSWSATQWQAALAMPPVATVVFLVGLTTLKAAGFGLVRSVPKKDHGLAIADEDPQLQPARMRTLQIRWTAGTWLVAIVTSVVLNRQIDQRNSQDEHWNRLAERLRRGGGELIMYREWPISIEIGKATTADWGDDLSSYTDVGALSLAGNAVDEELLRQLPQWFPNLYKLDLGHTGVTANWLPHLLPLTRLSSLGLAGSDLTIDEINNFVQATAKIGRGLVGLDLSDTRLSAEAISRLHKDITRLAIRRLDITDSELAAFQSRRFNELDISGNAITGQGLVGMHIQKLIAHDVPLTDAGLQAFLGKTNSSVEELVISQTRLTDQSAPLLLSLRQLHLGDGTISEAALTATTPTHRLILGLHGRQFTGACLAAIGPQADLGEALRQSESYLRGLWLSDTDITDRGIQGLDDVYVNSFDLRRTAVTAEAVIAVQASFALSTLYVDFDQFTPRQLDVLRQHYDIFVGNQPRLE